MTYTPLPTPCITDSFERLSWKGEKRWRDDEGFYYTHDTQHGDLEKFDKNGRHRGSIDPVTGQLTKPARRGRRIDV